MIPPSPSYVDLLFRLTTRKPKARPLKQSCTLSSPNAVLDRVSALFAFGQQASCWIGVVDPADWPSVMMTGTVQPRCVATPKSRSRRGC